MSSPAPTSKTQQKKNKRYRKKKAATSQLPAVTEVPTVQANQPVVTSLTSPNDKPKNFVYTPSEKKELTNNQVKELTKTRVLTPPMVERVWSDPPYRDCKYFTASFVPSRDAKPDKDGFFGMMKIRGTYSNDQDRKDHVDNIIRNVDSYHLVVQGDVGKPFPLAVNMEELCGRIDSVDVKEQAMSIISKDIKDKREKERKTIEEIKEQERNLVAKAELESKQGQDPQEYYIENLVKQANLVYCVIETSKRIKEYKASIKSCLDIKNKLDQKYPEFKKDFMKRYRQAADAAGIPDDSNNILRYLGKTIPFSLDDDESLVMSNELPAMILEEDEKELKEETKEEDEKKDC